MQPERPVEARSDPKRRRIVAMGALGGLFGIAALCKGASQPGGGHGGAAARTAGRTDELGLLCSPRNAAGVGLRGEYYEREGRAGRPWLVRTEGLVGCEVVSALSRHPGGLPARSARWSGWVKAPLPGLYRFHFDHPDARIVVAAVDFSAPSAGATPAVLDMTAGRFYPISVELDRVGPPGAAARLEWTPPHGHRFLVSRAMLFLPMPA